MLSPLEKLERPPTIQATITQTNLSAPDSRRPRPFPALGAWTLWALVIAASILSLILRIRNNQVLAFDHTPDGLVGFLYWGILIPAIAPAYGTIGAIIATLRPRNPLGWLLLGFALSVGLEDACWQFAASVLIPTAEQALPVYLATQGSNALSTLEIPLPAILLLLFPGGTFLSHRWKWLCWLIVLVDILHISGQIFAQSISHGSYVLDNPIGFLPFSSDQVNNIFFPLEVAIFFIAGGGLLLRWRRARDEERQQIKWLAYVLMIIVVTGPLALLIGNLFTSDTMLYIAITIGAVSIAGVSIGLPGAIGIAMLRHRLYDIDILMNRTLVYGSLTLFLALIYFGSVLLLQFVLSGSLPNQAPPTATGGKPPSGGILPPVVTSPGNPTPAPPSSGISSFTGLFGGLIPQDSPLANVVSTLVIVALFQPLRTSVQKIIDRRFYRRKYNAAKALDAFSATLRNQIDLEQLHAQILGVIEETMQPTYVSLWFCQPVRPVKPEKTWTEPLEPIIHSTGLLPGLQEMGPTMKYNASDF